jgi:hypothetical protein
MPNDESAPAPSGGQPQAPAAPATPATPAATPAAAPEGSLLAAPAAPTGAPSAPADPSEVAEKPEWLPENFWLEGKPDVERLWKSYASLQATFTKHNQGLLVQVPHEKSTPEEVAAYRKALGIPESADKYDIKPEKLPEGATWDDATAKRVAEVAHKHNIPPSAVKELVALDLERAQQMNAAAAKMLADQKAAAVNELRQVYKTELPAKLDLARRAAATAGIDPNDRGFESPAIVKFAIWAAEQISDDKLVEASATSMSSAQARAKDIMVNPQNPLYQRYQNGDPEIVDQVRRMLASQ